MTYYRIPVSAFHKTSLLSATNHGIVNPHLQNQVPGLEP
jgi:hypothetical protein